MDRVVLKILFQIPPLVLLTRGEVKPLPVLAEHIAVLNPFVFRFNQFFTGHYDRFTATEIHIPPHGDRDPRLWNICRMEHLRRRLYFFTEEFQIA